MHMLITKCEKHLKGVSLSKKIFILNFIYFWLGWVFVAVCGLLVVSGFSSCRAWTLGVRTSLVTACRLRSCGLWALEGGLVASQHGSYWTGLNSCPLHWQADS